MIPKILRRVGEVTHELILGGHQGIKQNKDRVQIQIFWHEL